MKKTMRIMYRRSAEEIAADIEESMKDPDFRRLVKDFIRQTTS